MKWKLAWPLGLALLLAATTTQAQESLRAFGLEFTVVSNAVLTIQDSYPALKVIQVGGPECGQDGGTNDLEDLPFGVSVHLGEAQSGVYVYPDAECRDDYRSMWGNAFGNVNGETNRLISSIKGTRLAWGEYQVEVDLTPLGATSYTYQVWSHGLLTLHATNQGARSFINTINIEDYDPRVNPILLTDTGPGALIEFPDGTQFVLSGDDSTGASGASGVGDRIFIIAEGATNHVSYVSRVDVFGSANLPSFNINDVRIGMFGRPHKALGDVNFAAAGGRLTAGPFQGTATNGPTNGILVDFKPSAIRWSAQTEPFTLGETNAQLLLSGSGLGSSDRPYITRYWGPAGFTRSNGVLHLSADFSGLGSSDCVLRVFRGNSLAGTIPGASGAVLATLTETNPMITGWASVLDSLSISIAEATGITGHEGTILEGDRFEFAPTGNLMRIGRLYSAHLLAQGSPAITIVSEFTEEAPASELKLQIERVASDLMVSFPYHPYVYVLARTNFADGYVTRDAPAEYRDFRWHMPVYPTNSLRFYTLRHTQYYYIYP